MYNNYEYFSNIENEILDENNFNPEINVEDESNPEITIEDDDSNIAIEDEFTKNNDLNNVTPEGIILDSDSEKESDDSPLNLDEETDSNLEVVNYNKLKEKIKNKEILKLSDFDHITDVVDKQIIQDEKREDSQKNMKKGIEIILYFIIGLLLAIIVGAFLKHNKKSKVESILEEVEPPKLY